MSSFASAYHFARSTNCIREGALVLFFPRVACLKSEYISSCCSLLSGIFLPIVRGRYSGPQGSSCMHTGLCVREGRVELLDDFRVRSSCSHGRSVALNNNARIGLREQQAGLNKFKLVCNMQCLPFTNSAPRVRCNAIES